MILPTITVQENTETGLSEHEALTALFLVLRGMTGSRDGSTVQQKPWHRRR